MDEIRNIMFNLDSYRIISNLLNLLGKMTMILNYLILLKQKVKKVLINNNSSFLKNIVLFLRNCISQDEKYYKRLADILIDDLNVYNQKVDKVYANNVLIPLLSIEKVTYVCLHQINEKIKNSYCSYINLETNGDNIQIEEKNNK